jgi:hypothetical protein
VGFQPVDDDEDADKDSFLRRVLNAANTPGANEALAQLEAEDRQTVASMERAQETGELAEWR